MISVFAILLLSRVVLLLAFSPGPGKSIQANVRRIPFHHIPSLNIPTRSGVSVFSSSSSESSSSIEATGERLPNSNNDSPTLVGVAAPLHRIGPYICLRLLFPDWKNNNNYPCDENNEISYSFMIDTGANVNSLDSKLVEANQLPEYVPLKFPTSTGLVGATTTSSAKGMDDTPAKAGRLHLLGDCQLAGLPPPPMTFLRNLVAASLPFASPVGVGILGLPFLWSFPAGVEFDWHGTDGDRPTMIFYYGNQLPTDDFAAMDRMIRVPLRALNGGLLTLQLTINGVPMRALLDTGSPLTVLNDAACRLLGMKAANDIDEDKSGIAVKIVGVDGSQSQLKCLDEEVTMHAINEENGDFISLGQGYIWSGELAGIELIRKLGDGSDKDEPAALLGLDFLQKTYRMLLRAPSNEVWFEELPQGFDRISA